MGGFQNMQCECRIVQICVLMQSHRALSLCVFEERVESERMNCIVVTDNNTTENKNVK